MLSNAVWFKVPWAAPFTFGPDAPFHMLDGTVTDVKTMSGRGSRYGEGDGWAAAAATAVIGEVTSAPVEFNHLVADRPFLYVIRDRATGVPLFMGRVVDPGVTSD